MVVLKDPYTAMMDNLPVDCDGTELERILEDLSYDSFKLEKEGRKSKGKDGCMEVMMMFHNYNRLIMFSSIYIFITIFEMS